MSTEFSKGKRRVRPLRAGRPPSPAVAALAAPHRDPRTGQWRSGNPGGRLRQLKALEVTEAESLLALPIDQVAPWLRPHLGEAQEHVQELVDALGTSPPAELVALCADEARARLFARACATEGARLGCSPAEARAWREEARAWLRESRQIVLTRKAVERERADGGSDEDELRRRQAAFQRQLAERQRTATTRPADASSSATTTNGASHPNGAPAGAEGAR